MCFKALSQARRTKLKHGCVMRRYRGCTLKGRGKCVCSRLRACKNPFTYRRKLECKNSASTIMLVCKQWRFWWLRKLHIEFDLLEHRFSKWGPWTPRGWEISVGGPSSDKHFKKVRVMKSLKTRSQ